MSALDIVVGRQPIFDHALSVMGYELLFRPVGPLTVKGSKVDEDQMTTDVLFGSINIGIERLVGDKKLFCNASRGLLLGEIPIVLPAERTVIEVEERALKDEEAVAGCRRVRDEGYGIALDKISWSSDVDHLLELVSIVKIDLQVTSRSAIPELVDRCHQRNITLIAEKVATLDELMMCEKLGFDYFQGYLLALPRPIHGRALDIGHLARLQMSARLVDSECSMADLEEIVRTDPAMVHQLLHLAGMGAAGGMRREVRSIREALVILGWRRLQSWVSLLLIADRGRGWQEGVTNTLIRARMCELLAAEFDPCIADQAFAVGMISNFDVLLGIPLDAILESLPLADELRSALVDDKSPLGSLVADVADYLLGRPERAMRSGLNEDTFSSNSLKALLWAVELSSVLDVARHS